MRLSLALRGEPRRHSVGSGQQGQHGQSQESASERPNEPFNGEVHVCPVLVAVVCECYHLCIFYQSCKDMKLFAVFSLLIFSLLSSCSSTPEDIPKKVSGPVFYPGMRFYYHSFPSLGFHRFTTCREDINPYFKELGVQCLCDNDSNAGYSYNPNEAGVTTRCISTGDWHNKNRQEEVKQRDEQKRQEMLAAERELERTRPEREAAAAAAERESTRKRLEAENNVRTELAALKKEGVRRTDVIDLIVNFQKYKGKKVFLKCWVRYMGATGGYCGSRNEKQRIIISAEGIDVHDFKWLLNSCNGSQRTNSSSCFGIDILGTVGTVDGEPALINASNYDVCESEEALSMLSAGEALFCPK